MLSQALHHATDPGAALREAVASGEVDFAVHSLKDLPTTGRDGLLLTAVLVKWRDVKGRT